MNEYEQRRAERADGDIGDALSLTVASLVFFAAGWGIVAACCVVWSALSWWDAFTD